MTPLFAPVRRRHVFFFSGFDPKGASFYHALYREQAALQGAVSGAEFDVGERANQAGGNACWTVQARCGGQDTQTVIEYVRWDDIVRAHWPRSTWQVLTGSVQAYWSALLSGTSLIKVGRQAPRTLVALAYPAICWFGVACLAAAMGAAVQWGLARAFPQWTGVGWIAGATVATGVVWSALQWEKRARTSWLLRIYRFADHWARGRVLGLPERLDHIARAVEQKLDDPHVDEVLLVGFSVGGMLGVAVTARVAQHCDAGSQALRKLSVLTLGHCIPLLGLMPRADGFRAELQRVGQQADVCWADVSAPTDWGSFALVDPVRLCAATQDPPGVNPQAMVSPRFHRLFETGVYEQLKKDKQRIHMQYLMAGQLPGGYDYFSLTAGPLGLRQRVAQAKIS